MNNRTLPSNGGLPASNGTGSPETHAIRMAMITPIASQLDAGHKPYSSGDQRRRAQISQEFENAETKESQVAGELEKQAQVLEHTVKYPEPDARAKQGMKILEVLLVALFFLSWAGSGVFIQLNFTDSLIRGMLLSTVVPLIPYIMKYLLMKAGKRWPLSVEVFLLLLFLAGFFVFVDQFGEKFAKQPGIEIPELVIDGDAGAMDDLFNPMAPVPLRRYYYGVITLESLGSFVFFSWLLFLINPRINPQWVEADTAVRELKGLLDQLRQFKASLRGEIAELDYRKNIQVHKEAALADLLQ